MSYILFGAYSGASDLNDLGHVVGWATISYVQHPYLWTQDGGARYLGSLAPDCCPRSGWANGVNDDDVVVGGSQVDLNDSHAFIWDSGNGMRDLNGLVENRGPIKLVRANDVSNRGWIVGDAQDTSAGNVWVALVLRPK